MDTNQFTMREYLAITDYEEGTIVWTAEIEAAYDKLYAAFDFGVACPMYIPQSWWDHQYEWYTEGGYTVFDEEQDAEDKL